MMPKKFAIRYFCNYIKFYVTFYPFKNRITLMLVGHVFQKLN